MTRPVAPASSGRRVWPRRVLMTGDAVGGVWPYALGLAQGFARRGVETLLAVMGGAPSAGQAGTAAAIPGLRLETSGFRLEWMAGAAADIDGAGRWLKGLEEDFAPDVIHLNGYAHADLDWRAPVVTVAHSCVRTWWRAVHGEDPPPEWDEYGKRVRRGLDAADLIVAPTAALLAAMTESYGELARTRVVANGRTRPPPGMRRPKEPMILCAARLWDEAKNVRALDAAARVLPWPVCVAGATDRPDGGPDGDFANIRPLGPLPEAELRRWLDRAAIFVSPALYEPFGLAVLEAAQSGCALVLSDIPSFREVWSDAAIFVPPRDSRALAQTLARLAADPDALRLLGLRAAQRAHKYGVEPMIRGTLDAYRAAAARHGRSFGGIPFPAGQQAAPAVGTVP